VCLRVWMSGSGQRGSTKKSSNSWVCRAAAVSRSARPRQSQPGMACYCESQHWHGTKGKASGGWGRSSQHGIRAEPTCVTTATAPKLAMPWCHSQTTNGRRGSPSPLAQPNRVEQKEARDRTRKRVLQCRAPQQIAPSVVCHQPQMGCAVCVGRAHGPGRTRDVAAPAGLLCGRLRCAELTGGGPKWESTTTRVA
jgi:hypothetical protein